MTAKSDADVNVTYDIENIKRFVDCLNAVSHVQHELEKRRLETYEGVFDAWSKGVDAWSKVIEAQQQYVSGKEDLALKLNKNIKPLFADLEDEVYMQESEAVVDEVYMHESEADEQQLKGISQTSTNPLLLNSVNRMSNCINAKRDTDDIRKSIEKLKFNVDFFNRRVSIQDGHEKRKLKVYQELYSEQEGFSMRTHDLILQLRNDIDKMINNTDVVHDVSSNGSEADEQQLRSISEMSTNPLYDASLSQSRESMDEETKFDIIRDWSVNSHASSLISSCVNRDCRNAPPSSSACTKAKRCWKEENSREEGMEEKKTVVLTPTVKKIKVKERCNQNEVVQEQPEDDDIKDNKENVRCKDYDDDLITERNEDNNNNNNNNEDQLKEEGYSNKTEKKNVKEKGGAVTIKQTLIDMFDTVIEVVKEALIVTSGHIAKLFKFKHRTSKSDKIPVQQDVKVEDPVDLIEPHTRKRKA